MSLTPREIVDSALVEHKPIRVFSGFSGGGDSLATSHWMMNNVPGCELFHINTGIGIERTREFVRDTCSDQHWPLHEIRAKEDCGQDYDAIVMEHGFPGPPAHRMMFTLLKERAIRKLVRDAKVGHSRRSRVIIATGVRYEESVRRMGYAENQVNRIGAQVWVSPIYWWSATERNNYIQAQGLPINPVSATLGMSGECLCGAFAHPGEEAVVRLVCPKTADRIAALERRVIDAGWTWGWEGRPPKKKRAKKAKEKFYPLCIGCEKVHEEIV